MAELSSDPITAAMIETEREVAGFAWDVEDTEAADPTGDRSLEDLGDGLEGQHEVDEDETSEEETGDELAAEEGEEAEAAQAAEVIPPAKVDPPTARVEPSVPPGRLREANEKARVLETERDALKAALDKRESESAAKLDLVMRELAALKAGPRVEPKAVEPPKVEDIPDIFEDPKGFAEHLKKGFQSELSKRDAQLKNLAVENSFAIAHAFHKETFEKAWAEINALDAKVPEQFKQAAEIYHSPNPGEALIAWHKRNDTFRRVGDDPTKFEERIRNETREALMKDPEFKKQLIAELRGEASVGDNGQPRTQTRLPKSLARAGGSNLGTDRIDPTAGDDSPQAIADSAWR